MSIPSDPCPPNRIKYKARCEHLENLLMIERRLRVAAEAERDQARQELDDARALLRLAARTVSRLKGRINQAMIALRGPR